jgi:hypothetical protein
VTSEPTRAVFRPGDEEAFARAVVDGLLRMAEKDLGKAGSPNEVTVEVQVEYKFDRMGDVKPCCVCYIYDHEVISCKGQCC